MTLVEYALCGILWACAGGATLAAGIVLGCHVEWRLRVRAHGREALAWELLEQEIDRRITLERAVAARGDGTN